MKWDSASAVQWVLFLCSAKQTIAGNSLGFPKIIGEAFYCSDFCVGDCKGTFEEE